jgi:hypothetical protein
MMTLVRNRRSISFSAGGTLFALFRIVLCGRLNSFMQQ